MTCLLVWFHLLARCLFAVGVPFARLTLTHPFSSLLANLENSASDQLMSEEPREPSAPKGISRREFARRAAVASAVAAVAPASALTSPSSPLNEHATAAEKMVRSGHLPERPQLLQSRR